MNELETIERHLDRSHGGLREAGHADLPITRVSIDANKHAEPGTHRAPAEAV